MLSPDAGYRYSWYHTLTFSVPFVFSNKTFEAKLSGLSTDKCFLASGSCVCASRNYCQVRGCTLPWSSGPQYTCTLLNTCSHPWSAAILDTHREDSTSEVPREASLETWEAGSSSRGTSCPLIVLAPVGAGRRSLRAFCYRARELRPGVFYEHVDSLHLGPGKKLKKKLLKLKD